MIIGSSFGGAPSLTATSGPGLSLMMEGLGLAVASETPVVVVDVQRGGPSTGIPTKSEQSDLNIAVYGLHGDAPHLVLAALDIRDCVFTLHWAMRLAEHLQTVAICLSDQTLGQSRAICDPPQAFSGDLNRVLAEPGMPGGPRYLRYALSRGWGLPHGHPRDARVHVHRRWARTQPGRDSVQPGSGPRRPARQARRQDRGLRLRTRLG